jgi:hypothetical protein
MRETELKEEQELQQCEETLKKRDTGGTIGEAQKEAGYILSLHTVNTLHFALFYLPIFSSICFQS